MTNFVQKRVFRGTEPRHEEVGQEHHFSLDVSIITYCCVRMQIHS